MNRPLVTFLNNEVQRLTTDRQNIHIRAYTCDRLTELCTRSQKVIAMNKDQQKIFPRRDLISDTTGGRLELFGMTRTDITVSNTIAGS